MRDCRKEWRRVGGREKLSGGKERRWKEEWREVKNEKTRIIEVALRKRETMKGEREGGKRKE